MRGEGSVDREPMTTAFDVGDGIEVEDQRAQRKGRGLTGAGRVPPEPACPPRFLRYRRHAPSVVHVTPAAPPPSGGLNRPSWLPARTSVLCSCHVASCGPSGAARAG